MKQRTIRLAATGARVATGAVVAAACVLGVVAGAAAPWPEVRNEASGVTVAPVPADAVLVCNGSFRALGRDATQASLMVSATVPTVRIDGAADGVEAAPLAMPDLAGGSGAQSLTGRVQDREVPQFSASESVRLSDDDLSGFAAAPCREPSLGTWLVGGDLSVGASDVIVLSNPGQVTATVDLAAYGDSRRASTVVVPAMTQLGVPLASVAAEGRAPVVHVSSSGAPIRAALQAGLVRTLDPVGIDLQDGMSGPQSELLILGARSAAATEGDDTTGVVVRMLSPEDDATATVRVLGAAPGQAFEEYPVELAAGLPVEIALSGLPDGAHDIAIESSAPVVAAARQTARAGAEEDFAWALPSPELAAKATTLFSVPGGAPATLFLRNSGDEPITASLSGTRSQDVQLPAGASAELVVSAGGYALTATGRVHAAVGMRGGAGSPALAGWPLWAGAATHQPIVVRTDGR